MSLSFAMKETLQLFALSVAVFPCIVSIATSHTDGFGAVVNGRSYRSSQPLGLTKLFSFVKGLPEQKINVEEALY